MIFIEEDSVKENRCDLHSTRKFMVQLNRNIDPTVDHNIYKVLFNKFNSINLFKLFICDRKESRDSTEMQTYRYIVLITDILYTGILSSLLTNCIQVYCPHSDKLYTGILSSLLTNFIQVYCPHYLQTVYRYIVIITDILTQVFCRQKNQLKTKEAENQRQKFHTNDL